MQIMVAFPLQMIPHCTDVTETGCAQQIYVSRRISFKYENPKTTLSSKQNWPLETIRESLARL